MKERQSGELVAKIKKKKEVLSMKNESTTTKYLVHAKIETNGVVDRPDVVGAIFGQTEGLLGDELDLRELLKSMRIGRIKVDITSNQGKSAGTIIIPSSLDRVETSIIAAALETIDRVGPCEAKITVERIEDLRDSKRESIIKRAKEILQRMEEEVPESQELSEKVKESVRVDEISEYQGLPAGPTVQDSDAIVIVEGRADILNLLKCGIKNTIAIEGVSVPQPAIELCKNKTSTAFVDSDRGGDLILRELFQVAKIDFVARPPTGRSVEELTKKEILKALRSKVPATQVMNGLRRGPTNYATAKYKFTKLREIAENMQGSLKGWLLDSSLEKREEVDVRNLKEKLLQENGVKAVVFDGVVTQELADIAKRKQVEYLVGMMARVENRPAGVRILTLGELRGGQISKI
jgi:DNA primase